MAKVGFWLKGARGKLAGSVLAHSPNGTIIRENKVGANPKTMPQAVQRACFATASKTSAALKEVVESSFDGAKNGEESRRAFVALALETLKAQYTGGYRTLHLLSKNSGLQVPNSLQVSKGSLGNIELNEGFKYDGTDYIKIVQGAEGIADAITFGQFKAKYPSVKAGSQVTFIWGENLIDGDDSTFRWKYARFVINPNIKDSDTLIDAENVQIPATAIVTAKTEGFSVNKTGDISLNDLNYMSIVGLETGTTLAFYNEAGISGQAMIISNFENGEWIHSNSFTQCTQANDNAAAIESYMNAAKISSTTSDYYTEQAVPVEEGNVSYDSLNQALQGVIRAQGYQPKSLDLEGANTYGPIPEGNTIEITLSENQAVYLLQNTVRVLIGETAVADAWIRRINGSMVAISFPVAFGASQSVVANITFSVGIPGQTWENVGFRTTIQKVQA